MDELFMSGASSERWEYQACPRARRGGAGLLHKGVFGFSGLVLLTLGCLPQDSIADPADLEGEPAESSDDNLNIRGVFDSTLPNTLRKYAFKVSLHPHFGDFHRHDSFRIPLDIRYGLTSRLEMSLGAESFVDHGFGVKSWGEDYGYSGWHLGAKYHGRFLRDSKWDQIVGFDYSTPAGDVPADLTDGLDHFRSFMNFAKPIPGAGDSRIFWGLGLDFVSESGFAGSEDKNRLMDDSQSFTFGRVWEREKFNFTVETSIATTRLLGSNDRDLITVKPGIIWKVPTRYTFNSKDHWLLGLGVRTEHGHDGFDVSFSVKLKVNLDFD